MSNPIIEAGVVHSMPDDIKKVLLANKPLLEKWNKLTPLARNEWICWVTDGKLAETRVKRIRVGISKMNGGMRRPCCWQGCPHRVRNGKA